MISIAGRPRRLWYGGAKVMEDCLVIRLDDKDDPEFWLEIALCPEEMEGILAQWVANLDAIQVQPAYPFVEK